jgi:uncharacterized membrane protein YbaN (DUF454 family)
LISLDRCQSEVYSVQKGVDFVQCLRLRNGRRELGSAVIQLTFGVGTGQEMKRGVTSWDEPGRFARSLGSGGNLATVVPVRNLRQLVDWGLAGLFFVLAMLGVVLPGLPTTPFLLLMCHFLIRVSPSLHAKAMAWPVVGGPLRDWHHQQGIRPRVRVLACTMVLLLVGTTLWFGPLPLIAKAAIACAAGYGLYIIVRLPTARPDRLANLPYVSHPASVPHSVRVP